MKFKMSKTARCEYAAKMAEIEDFCKAHDIKRSFSGDSYYFYLNGQNYRVSNHTVAESNRAAFEEFTGEQLREVYHEGGERADTIYIKAGKLRICEIYNALAAGKEVDECGRVL